MKESNGVIYCLINTITGLMYIGKTVNLRHRLSCHMSDAYNTKRDRYGCYLSRAIRKYGWNNFMPIVIDIYYNYLDCVQKETWWISFYNTKDKIKGYNLTNGGEGMLGYSPSIETRERIGKANRGGVFTEEHRRKIAESHTGEKCTWSKAVLCVEDNKIFGSINDAVRYYKIDKKGISLCCRNKQKVSGKYHWRYI